MTSEGSGEMYEDNSADTCAEKFPLTAIGAERRVPRAQTRERGPPSHEGNLFMVLISFFLVTKDHMQIFKIIASGK